MEDLHARYAASFAGKHAALTTAWEHFLANPRDATALRDLYTLLHRLAGSAFSYDYNRLGERAREAERVLRSWDESPEETRGAAADLAKDLAEPVRRVLAELAQSAAPSTS